MKVIFSLALLFALQSLGASPRNEDTWGRQVVASCLILEASNQGEEGMRAVAAVIANRADQKPSGILSIVITPYAFTALNGATTGKKPKTEIAELVHRASGDLNWNLALRIAGELYEGGFDDPTFGADHYSRKDELPSWSHGMRATAVIGDHLFFKAH